MQEQKLLLLKRDEKITLGGDNHFPVFMRLHLEYTSKMSLGPMGVSCIECDYSRVAGFLLASRLGFAPNTLNDRDYRGNISDLVDLLTFSSVHKMSDPYKSLPGRIASRAVSSSDMVSGVSALSPLEILQIVLCLLSENLFLILSKKGRSPSSSNIFEYSAKFSICKGIIALDRVQYIENASGFHIGSIESNLEEEPITY